MATGNLQPKFHADTSIESEDDFTVLCKGGQDLGDDLVVISMTPKCEDQSLDAQIPCKCWWTAK